MGGRKKKKYTKVKTVAYLNEMRCVKADDRWATCHFGEYQGSQSPLYRYRFRL